MHFLLSTRRYQLIFAALLILALGLRIYKIGQIPHGITWDEAAIGYNGFAIWETHRDEWLHFMPISFQSFGDYKSPLAIYLVSFFVGIFGLEPWVVRLPFVLAGVGAVAATVLLLVLLLKDAYDERKTIALALLGGSLLTLSPWHLHFSRAGFESGMALFFYVTTLAFLFAGLTTSGTFKKWLFICASGGAAATLYTYHSAKIVLPLIGFYLFFAHRKSWLSQLKDLLPALTVGILASLPLVYDTLFGAGGQRLSQTSVFGTATPWWEKIGVVLINLVRHLTPDFLILGQTQTLRHGTGEWGVLFPTTFFFVLIGVGIWVGYMAKRLSLQKTQACILNLGLAMTVIGLLPATLGVDEIPHPNRALLALPGFILVAIIGIAWLYDVVQRSRLNQTIFGNHGEKEVVLKAAIGAVITIHLALFLHFYQLYVTSYAAASTADFQDGYLQVMKLTQLYEKGLEGKPQVEKIVFTTDYGQPYIYALFVRQTNPIYYQGGSLIKYEFKDVNIGDLDRKNTLVVGSGSDDLPTPAASHLIHGADGSVRFQVFYLP